jgi:hypothetical protein
MIISIKSSASGGSSRGLVHYLAHSKLDTEKEGIERREFFNHSEDDLDVRAANRHLSLGDAKPKPEELLHIVIAPSKEEIAKVGSDQRERKKSLQEIVRETVARLEMEVKTTNLKWVAVAHFNTDNPHAHLAIQKQFINENGEAETLRINRRMLHYNERGADGEKKLYKGALILAAENKAGEIAQTRGRHQEIEKTSEAEKTIEKSKTQTKDFGEFSSGDFAKSANWRERRILAEEMLALSEIKRRTRNIENLVEHGDKKRFKIKDAATGHTRHASLFDIERKIQTVSRRKARLAHPKNAEKRAEATVLFAREERAKHTPVIEQLETIRRHVLGFENRHLSEAQAKHTRLHNQKLLIEKKYERLKSDVPTPLFKPDEIQRLQTEAIREQNSEKTLQLETIRQSNAAELNLPSRRERDVRELLATVIVSKLKTQAAEKRLLGFAANKDFIKVKIGDVLWSHQALEQHEIQAGRKNNFWMRVKSKTNGILFRPENEKSAAEKLDYPSLHQAISDALENLENLRRNEIAKQKEFGQTLDVIFNTETNPNKNNLAPAFSAFVLAEAEDLARDAGREDFYENSLVLQENWLREKLTEKLKETSVSNKAKTSDVIEIQKGGSSAVKTPAPSSSETRAAVATEKSIAGFILGRAEARGILAQIKVNQAEENLTKFERDKLFIKHRIKDAKTGAEYELSLRETEPRQSYYLLDSILERALETKEQKNRRDVVQQAVKLKEKELQLVLKAAQNQNLRLENQKTLMLDKFSDAPEVQPIFTPKEIAALDVWRDLTTNKSEADKLGKIITEAEAKERVARLQEFLEKAEKELQIIAPDLAVRLESKISRADDLSSGRQTVAQNQKISHENSSSESANRASRAQIETQTATHEKNTVKEKGRSR